MNLIDLYEMRDRRDAYQRDYDHSVGGMGRRDSYAYSQDGGANDESHDLDPTEWYIVKDGKMFKATVYPNQVQSAMTQGYSPSREQARAKADQQGMTEAVEDRTSYQVAKALFDYGIKYDPARENDLIKAIGMVLVKELNMSPKMARSVMNDEDFLGDTLGELRHMESGMAEGKETPEKEIERLKLRQNAEHGGASLKRQAETQARIRELEKAQKNQGVATEDASWGMAESSQQVDSLVTDALKIMQGATMNDAVAALKTVLGNREYNDRRGHYSFYVRQLMDMYGQQGKVESELNEFLNPQAVAQDPGLEREPTADVIFFGQMPKDFTADTVWEALEAVLPQEYPPGRNTQGHPTSNAERVTTEIAKHQGAVVTTKPLSVAQKLAKTFQTYGIKCKVNAKPGMNEGKADYNFDIEDLKRLETIRDLSTLKTQALALISKPSAKPMKPEKVEWFKNALERMNSPLKVIKLMYDLLLSGEGNAVVGSRSSMNPNSYRQRFSEQGMAEADVDSDGHSVDHADSGEYDYEGDQAKDQLNTIVRAARRLDGMLDDNENMPEWVQMKITNAADYIDTAADYIESNQEPELAEGDRVGNMDADKFDAAMARLKQLAGAGPLKTVYDPTKRVYRNVPTAVQPRK
jgi:hypothetical protein